VSCQQAVSWAGLLLGWSIWCSWSQQLAIVVLSCLQQCDCTATAMVSCPRMGCFAIRLQGPKYTTSQLVAARKLGLYHAALVSQGLPIACRTKWQCLTFTLEQG
jgi:hypothetical protein